ncbi:MAG TPA: phosphopantetheine-binding protein [Gammaproteobacteria bacterium]|nr:phosphopantetheine-binding protein [Gammaproteobacteria bacterium]
MNEKNAIGPRLLDLFANAFQIEAPAADLDLIDSGVLDSLQLVELLYRLEQEFGTRIPIEDIDLDDLRTLERIAGLIAARTAATDSTPSVGVSP